MSSSIDAARRREAVVRDHLRTMAGYITGARLSHALGEAGKALDALGSGRALYTFEQQGLDSLLSLLAVVHEMTNRQPRFAALEDAAAAYLKRAVALRHFTITGRAP
jgi:hypothetical protein